MGIGFTSYMAKLKAALAAKPLTDYWYLAPEEAKQERAEAAMGQPQEPQSRDAPNVQSPGPAARPPLSQGKTGGRG
jgi:hypothetical protein